MTGPSRPTVLLAYPLADPAASAYLAQRVEVVVAGDFAALLERADAVIVRPPTRIDAELLARAGRLRVIANIGSGIDHLDVAGANARGIEVLSQPGTNAHAVAEYVIAELITVSRRLDAAAAFLRPVGSDGLDWGARIGTLRGHELAGRTLGIVGFGAVGRELARMARGALGLRVISYDPYAAPQPGEVDAVCASLTDLLEAADVVSVHVPLTDATRGLIGAGELDRLGPDGIVINTSRGGVVDEQAVVDALRAGRLRGAVLDVFDTEPPTAQRSVGLSAVPGLIMTPHIAGITHEAGSALAWAAVRGVLEHLGLG